MGKHKRVWRESDHPRDKRGRFTKHGKGAVKAVKDAAKKVGPGLEGFSGEKKAVKASPEKKAASKAVEAPAKKAAPAKEAPAKAATKVAGPDTLPKKKVPAEPAKEAPKPSAKAAPAAAAPAKSKMTMQEAAKKTGLKVLPNGEIDFKAYGITVSSSTGRPIDDVPEHISKLITRTKALAGGAKGPAKRDYGRFKSLGKTGAARLHRAMTDAKPWTSAQSDALEEYTDESYRGINDHLRGIQKDGKWTETIRDMRAGMREVPEDIVVFRSVGGAEFGAPEEGAEIPDDKLNGLVGRTWSDPAFTSTSVIEGGFNPNYRTKMVISVPKGTKGAYLESVTRNSEEYELLLDTKTHYKIIKAEKDEFGYSTLYMEVVKQGA